MFDPTCVARCDPWPPQFLPSHTILPSPLAIVASAGVEPTPELSCVSRAHEICSRATTAAWHRRNSIVAAVVLRGTRMVGAATCYLAPRIHRGAATAERTTIGRAESGAKAAAEMRRRQSSIRLQQRPARRPTDPQLVGSRTAAQPRAALRRAAGMQKCGWSWRPSRRSTKPARSWRGSRAASDGRWNGEGGGGLF